MDKDSLRNPILKQRKSYSVLERAPMDKIIYQQVMDYITSYTNIALYAANYGEVDTYEIMNTLWLDGKKVYLPKVTKEGLKFYEVLSFDELQLGTFGILEPKEDKKSVSKEEIEVMLIPLLVYNKDNYRIGYGKGYYDRYLKDYSGLKIGLAYHFQYSEVAFQDKWDIPCDVIVTDK